MSNIDNLIKQIQSQGTTSKWTGGVGADAATKDMARILDSIGITDINQFGPVTKEVDLYMGEGVDGTPIYQKQIEQTFGNKETGQAVPVTYSERQTGNAFGGTFEGKGNTGYRVDFTPEGKPVFYTTGASSSNAGEIIKPFAQMALLAAGIGGLESLGLGAGASGAAAGGGAAGATGAGLASAGELGTIAGMGGGTGLSAGASGLGLNAAGAGLGSLGTGAGITAGAGLTGTGVLTGSTLGTGLLGTGAGLAGLTGTGVLSGSELGKALLGTTSTTPLVGTGVLSGSNLGAQLLGTGANTAATVGGLTGLTNAANVGAGALNTGVSTGITGLGSGALNTGVNPSGASTISLPIETPVTPTPPTKGLGVSDALRAASLVGALAGGAKALGGDSGGFPIVPIPSDWTSPIKPTGVAEFKPLTPIDFGSKEMLRGTQWEKLLDPNYGTAPAMPTSTNPSNMTFNELTRILGGSRESIPTQNLSINDVIAGIQSQYGQTPQGSVG
jgi:hypothetical protein